MKLLMLTGILAVIFLSLPFTVQGQTMYSWTDENGVVHFSDTKPEGQAVQEQAIPQQHAPSSDNPYAQPDSGQPSAAEQRRQELSRKHAEAQQQKAMTDSQCAAWQAEVDRLEPNRRVFYEGENGETVRMDDVERTNRVADLKRQIGQNCR